MALDLWRSSAPSLEHFPEKAVSTFTNYVRAGEALLAALPPKPERSQDDLACAQIIHNRCRRLRRDFMELHADWIYCALTDNRRNRRSLSELAYGASKLCPGLVPTAIHIAQERAHIQTNKEGYEIDQGIFFMLFYVRP